LSIKIVALLPIAADIRQLYTPIQPSVKHMADAVTYYEFLPHSRLQYFIYCYWELKTLEPLSEGFTYRVVADGCIDIFFELNRPEEHFVMGFCKKYTTFSLDTSFHYIGIRFLPTMFPQLFGTDASLLSNRYEPLDAVLPPTARFIREHFHSGQPLAEIKEKLDGHFLECLSQARIDPDPRLYNAIAIILENYGVLDIEKDLDTGISPRQLRRIFEYYVGDTAKTFSKVVRFQNILKAKPSVQSLRQSKLFFNAGYYDQAHFIKEFKNFFGLTPSKAFGR
jgi:AraC-like DNA-binding protein